MSGGLDVGCELGVGDTDGEPGLLSGEAKYGGGHARDNEYVLQQTSWDPTRPRIAPDWAASGRSCGDGDSHSCSGLPIAHCLRVHITKLS
jgi:hypothetical protein